MITENTLWHEICLGNVMSIKHGWPFKSELFSEELTGNPIIVSIGNFEYTGGFRFDSTKNKEYRGEYPSEYELSPGDILLIMTCQTSGGEILGIPARVPNDGRIYLHNQRTGKVVITRPDMIDTDFAYWLFRWPRFNNELFLSASGTKILHTSPSRIESFRFSLPPLPIQRRIAAILGALDDKIEVNRRINRTLEALAQALFKHWFVDFGPFQDGPFVETALGMVPAGWGVGKLDDVAKVNPSTIRKGQEPKEIIYVDISSVSTGQIDDFLSMSFADAPSRAQRLVKHGDIIWAAVRPNRRAFSLIQYPDEKLVVSTGFAVIRPERVPYSYIYSVLSTQEFTDYLVSRATGAAYPAVNSKDFKLAPVLIPKSDVIKDFHRYVEPWLEQKYILQQEIRSLAATRDYLLPRLLSGEIAVAAAEETGAESL